MNHILILLVVVAVTAFGADYLLKKEAAANAPQVAINDLGTFASASRDEAIARFAGKPAVVFIAGTFCPHCQTSLPTYKTDIFDVYAIANDEQEARAHVFVNVTDGANGDRFNVEEIPQGFDAQLSFENLTDESCNYVPSWVVLDAEGAVADKACGSEKDNDAIITALEALLIE